MINRRGVGRPAMWHKPILDYVEEHGEVRALEIRIELGVSERTLYKVLNRLVVSGALVWNESRGCGNYRTVSKAQSLPRLDMLLCHPHI